MKKCIRFCMDFAALRRRSDKVKAALLLFLLGGYMGVQAVGQGAAYARSAARPAEYVCTPNASGAVLQAKLDALAQEEGVADICPQWEFTLVKGEKALAVLGLPARYLSAYYGLAPAGYAHEYWLDPQTFAGFLSGSPPARTAYQREEKREDGVFLRADTLPDGVHAVTAWEGQRLTAPAFRVRCTSADLSGTVLHRLEASGFTLLSQEQITLQGYENQILLERLAYNLLSGGLACLAGWALYTLGKREVAGHKPPINPN